MSAEYQNRPQRFRISPRGLINLASKERKALAFIQGAGRFLNVEVDGQVVRILPADKPGPSSVKASPRGLFQLPSDAHKVLSGGKKGHYTLVSEAERRGKEATPGVHLRPA